MVDDDSDREEIPTGSKLEMQHGWIYRTDSDRVWNDDHDGAGWLIQTEDGEVEEHIQRAKNKIANAEATLWTRLGSLEYDGLEIRRNAQLWHDDRDEWLIAKTIDVTQDAEPLVRFRVKGSWPVEHVTYRGSTLEDLRNEGVLETKEEVNDQMEALLENM